MEQSNARIKLSRDILSAVMSRRVAGQELAQIARETGLKRHVVSRAIYATCTTFSELESRGPKSRERACMSCGNPFFSEHYGHRMCAACRGVDMQDHRGIDE